MSHDRRAGYRRAARMMNGPFHPDPDEGLGRESDTTMSEDDTTPGMCRRMETRTCPPSGPCGAGPCARFESDDPGPWQVDTGPAIRARVWTVSAEFGVQSGATWQPCCAGCLPILVRRAHRRGWPLRILRWTGTACQVRDPHPDPRHGVPPEGYSCPRPLTGPCLDAKCDHD